MDRRTALAFGLFSAAGLGGCSGGSDSSSSPPPPAPQGLRATGWTQMPIDDYRNIPEAVSGNFPPIGGFTSFDMSDSQFLGRIGWPRWLPEPDNQGQQPSCTAWAVGYASATSTLNYSGTTLSAPISPADLFAKVQRRTPGACTQGSFISTAMDVLVQEGVTTLDRAPYSDRQCGIAATQQLFNLDGFSRIAADDAVAVRAAVQMFQPVSFGMLVPDSFGFLTGANPVFVPTGAGSGHAMSVIGYDDARQQYKVINSWGRSWGAGGYFWIAYRDFGRFAVDVCIPYRRRSASNQLLSRTTSNANIPIVAEHLYATPYGSGQPGSYGVGAEMGWSSVLDVRAASISVLDDADNVLSTHNFTVRQICRGIRFGTRIPDAVAGLYRRVRATVSGFDAFGAALTLGAVARPPMR